MLYKRLKIKSKCKYSRKDIRTHMYKVELEVWIAKKKMTTKKVVDKELVANSSEI